MIRLHHCAQARSFRTLWLLHEMGLDFEVEHHSFFTGELRSGEYLSISPAGRVPALEIDGRVIFESGAITEVQVAPQGTPGGNPAFDVTPARLVTGLITERGVAKASPEALAEMFPEMAGRTGA